MKITDIFKVFRKKPEPQPETQTIQWQYRGSGGWENVNKKGNNGRYRQLITHYDGRVEIYEPEA